MRIYYTLLLRISVQGVDLKSSMFSIVIFFKFIFHIKIVVSNTTLSKRYYINRKTTTRGKKAFGTKVSKVASKPLFIASKSHLQATKCMCNLNSNNKIPMMISIKDL